jgi:hypothetical protein
MLLFDFIDTWPPLEMNRNAAYGVIGNPNKNTGYYLSWADMGKKLLNYIL